MVLRPIFSRNDFTVNEVFGGTNCFFCFGGNARYVSEVSLDESDCRILPDQKNQMSRERTPLPNIFYTTAATALASTICAASYAHIKGLNIPATAVHQASNTLLVALPFLTIRETILHFKPKTSVNRDHAIASTASGMAVGAWIGWLWRGRWAIVAGMGIYGGIAATGQFILSAARNYRYTLINSRLEKGYYYEARKERATIMSLMRDPFVENSEMKVDEADDPVKEVFQWFVRQLEDTFGRFPERASPFVNALDLEYRMRLNRRIELLERQIKELRNSD